MFPSSRKSGATRRVCAAPDDVPRGHDDRMTLGVTGGVTSRPYAGGRRRGTVGPRAVGSGRAPRKAISTVAAVVTLALSACGGPARTPTTPAPPTAAPTATSAPAPTLAPVPTSAPAPGAIPGARATPKPRNSATSKRSPWNGYFRSGANAASVKLTWTICIVLSHGERS